MVRKLLVASQKSGVGKTTTSVNLAAAAVRLGTRVLLLDADPLSNISTALRLAEHPHRQSLRPIGINLPGVLVSNIVPGLDILSPYEEGSCSDEDLDRLLFALSTPVCQQCYGCILVDVPPFMGANPGQLIDSCDEFLLVMRAEPSAHRTLPAFLELVQRSSRSGHVLQLRGILLTLPEGEEVGCRWERELRGRFGARVRPEVIPHDESVAQAFLSGGIASHLHPDSSAARQFHQLAESIELAEEPRPAASAEQVVQTLREAAAVARPTRAAPSVRAEPRAESMKPAQPAAQRKRRSSRTLSAASPSTTCGDAVVDHTPASASAPTPSAPANGLAQLWPLWILLGAVLGGGLRFLPLSPSMLPVLVGLGVAVLIVVVLGAHLTREHNVAAKAESVREPSRARERKKSSGRLPIKKDIGVRLSALGSRKLKAIRPDPNAN